MRVCALAMLIHSYVFFLSYVWDRICCFIYKFHSESIFAFHSEKIATYIFINAHTNYMFVSHQKDIEKVYVNKKNE